MGAVIQLKAEIVNLMQDDFSPTALPDRIAKAKQDLDDELARLGGVLQPMHPHVQDAELMTYFSLSGIPDFKEEAAVDALIDLEAVTAAYVKPDAEPA